MQGILVSKLFLSTLTQAGDSVTFAHNIAANVNLTQSSPVPLINACSKKTKKNLLL